MRSKHFVGYKGVTSPPSRTLAEHSDFVGACVILVRRVIYLPNRLHAQDSKKLFPIPDGDFEV